MLYLLLAVSLALRVVLAVGGGQQYWTDEGRFGTSQAAARALVSGQFRHAFDEVFSNADHMLFKIAGVLPALVQQAAGGALWIPPCFFGAFSVAAIYLVWRLVIERGGTAVAGLCAAFLAASCNFLFYYSRHNFPYDLSLALLLGALLLGLRGGRYNAVACGILVGLGFLAYNGYWIMGGLVVALSIGARSERLAVVAARAACATVGVALPIAMIVAIGRLLGHDLVRSFIEFSHTTGTDPIGVSARLIPGYFWSSEHAIVLVWIGSLMWAASRGVQGRLPRGALIWSAGAILYFAGMVLPSLVHRFGISGRHTRPEGIFCCLVGGCALGALWDKGKTGRRVLIVLVAGVAVQAALNMAVPLKQTFPLDFVPKTAGLLTAAAKESYGPFRVLNADYFEGSKSVDRADAPAVVLYRERHPHAFIPYLYEGYDEAQRAEFLRQDMDMRVVRLLPAQASGRPPVSRSAGPWAPYLGPVNLGIRFDPGKHSSPQPLLSSGSTGSGDGIFVQFPAPNTVRLGIDHWGGGARFSGLLPCDFAKPHVLTISGGFLYPRESDPRFERHPEWRPLRHTLFVALDGIPAIAWPLDANPAEPQTVQLLNNLIGLSSSEREFLGAFLYADRADPSWVLSMLQGAK